MSPLFETLVIKDTSPNRRHVQPAQLIKATFQALQQLNSPRHGRHPPRKKVGDLLGRRDETHAEAGVLSSRLWPTQDDQDHPDQSRRG